MNLIDHLEHIIGLLERGASHAEIKSSLLSMREQLDGAQQSLNDKAKLAEENTKLRKTIEQFVSASKLKRPGLGIPPQAPNIM